MLKYYGYVTVEITESVQSVIAIRLSTSAISELGTLLVQSVNAIEISTSAISELGTLLVQSVIAFEISTSAISELGTLLVQSVITIKISTLSSAIGNCNPDPLVQLVIPLNQDLHFNII